MSNLLISVIICTYNRAELLPGALRSLGVDQDFENYNYEIVVVDDGSTDDTAAVVKGTHVMCSLRYFRIDHAGRSAARNKGIAEARGEFILFVDDDILAPSNLLRQHLDAHKTYRKSVVRGPIINVTEYAIPQGRGQSWRDFSSAFFCTCNASVSKYALLTVGGFDESFVEYGFEDNELGWRLRRGGWKCHFNMRAAIYHYKPTIKRDQLAEMVRRAEELGRSAVIYYDKHPHWQVALATGLHPALRWWNALQRNQWLYDYCLRQWNASAESMPMGRRAWVERRIFTYHYLRSLQAENNRRKKRSDVVARAADVSTVESQF